MTVAELIAKLQEMPQEARVVVDGCSYGLVDVDEVRTALIVLNSRRDISGLHDEWTQYMKREPDETAVYIG